MCDGVVGKRHIQLGHRDGKGMGRTRGARVRVLGYTSRSRVGRARACAARPQQLILTMLLTYLPPERFGLACGSPAAYLLTPQRFGRPGGHPLTYLPLTLNTHLTYLSRDRTKRRLKKSRAPRALRFGCCTVLPKLCTVFSGEALFWSW